MDLHYNNSVSGTVGIELEMRILDPESLNIKNCSNIIFDAIDDELKPHIHKELLQSMFEIVTPVCSSVGEAVDFIDRVTKKIARIGHKSDFLIAALATHPFEDKEDNHIVHDPRYKAFKEEFQIVIRNFLISGLHIHIGIPDKESAISAYNGMINYLPLFLSLSANSPFLHGENTGLKSYRTKVFDKLPRAGVPEYFASYDEYTRLYRQLYETGYIHKSKDVWWDVRISPQFGTLELRVCDAFYDKDRLRFISLLYQAVVLYSQTTLPPKEFHQINLQNKWNATRHGLDGHFIEQGRKVPMRAKITQLIQEMETAGVFEQLKTQDAINELKWIIDQKSPSCTLRDIYSETHDLKTVVKSQVIGES
jgi:carboxylate-amine ligase